MKESKGTFEWIKEKSIKHPFSFSTSLSLIGVVIGSISLFKSWNVWVLSLLTIVYIITTGLILYFFIKKSGKLRSLNKDLTSVKAKVDSTFNTFHKTHNTWHLYNKLSNKLYNGFDIHDIRLRLHQDITNLLTNLRSAFKDIHPDSDYLFSMKIIEYKDYDKLNSSDGNSYVDIPFVLKDSGIRDPKRTPGNSKEIVDNLVFDTTNPEYAALKDSVFYKSFLSKCVVYCEKFEGHQINIAPNYKSTIVAPLLINDIPFGFISLGASKEKAFRKDDKELVETFSDCISEFFRLDTIFKSILYSRKVIVMDDVKLKALLRKGNIPKIIDGNKNKE